ncbi:hypothetical protein EDC40_10718 [Aminobacter aminovorans]|uniref:Amidohydrolase n=1 Tax=Aminobacter aminovorans TaxID=83263 RepID=A0A381IL36_AMIAI|nr:hypothetical protein EDC40_10718 [Aminobacter aminovorans]SUY28188.1 Uncharacterised protein [Aminobacter aminovorans]
MLASEEFGVFDHNAASAMFFLGAGGRHPALHNPDYDSPDDVIPIASNPFFAFERGMGRWPKGNRYQLS